MLVSGSIYELQCIMGKGTLTVVGVFREYVQCHGVTMGNFDVLTHNFKGQVPVPNISLRLEDLPKVTSGAVPFIDVKSLEKEKQKIRCLAL